MGLLRLAVLTMSLLAVDLHAQQTLAGVVHDVQSHETLAGVVVQVKGTAIGAITDANGKFAIPYTGAFPLTLVFSYEGYQAFAQDLDTAQFVQARLQQQAFSTDQIVVTARRRNEELQEIPLAVSVLSSQDLENSLSFNVNRVKELVPSVQFYSSNPRNTTLNIRGLGSTFGLTNDGIDPGVGFYVDGVYYARAAAATLDFIDVQQIEVLRGPQGTLFGKNTTAGTFNITSKKPTFTPTAIFEQSLGNYGFSQSKASVSFPLIKDKLAIRLSLNATYRGGLIENARTGSSTNTLNNNGGKVYLRYFLNDKVNFSLIADFTRQRPDGYAVVLAGVVPTQRPAFRQYEQIIADLNYTPVTRNAFDRVIDHDTPWRSNQDMGGVAFSTEAKLGKGTLTSTTAWRYWVWDPSNDRDFTGLQALRLSQAPSVHHQYSQEVRFAGDLSKRLNGVLGLFGFYQDLRPKGAHVEESGNAQWRFAQNSTSTLWATPGLLDGYGIRSYPLFSNFSGAVFAQADWKLTKKLTLIPGARLNYDKKRVDFKRVTYGGLQTDDAALLQLKNAVYTNQAFVADVEDWNLSGKLSVSYALARNVRVVASSSLGFKPVGLNLGGLPTQNGAPQVELAVVKPERVQHHELLLKSEPVKQSTLNLAVFSTHLQDYQTLVQSPQLGVNRGYLANANAVRVQGIELDASYHFPKHFRFNVAVAYTDGVYLDFKNASLPLEQTGLTVNGQQQAFTDASGGRLPGISTWAGSAGAEWFTKTAAFDKAGEWFIGFDSALRSEFSSSPTPSHYLNIAGYALLNARLGYRQEQGLSLFVWVRNLTNADYFEQLLPAAGNAGHYGGVLGDPQTYGVTLRYNFY